MNANLSQQPARGGRGGLWKLIVLAAMLVGLLVVFKFIPVKEYLFNLLQWIQDLGVVASVFVVVIYIAACILMVPGSVLTVGAGFLFGLLVGTITVSLGSTLGACAAFIVGRTFARGWVEQRVTDRLKFRSIDEAVGKEGFKIVLLTRLSPIFPFNLLNYAYGLTKVRFWSYALASWLGMLPGTVMFVYLGSAARSLTEAAAPEVQKAPAERIFFWVGLVMAVVVAVVVTRIARRALHQAVGQEAR